MWGEWLPHVEFSNNKVVHCTTQFQPFEIAYHFNPLTPLNLLSFPNTSLLKHKYGKELRRLIIPYLKNKITHSYNV